MTEQEKEIIDLLANAWNLFLKLPNHHPMDKQEFASYTHALQEKIMAREAVRNNPEIFNQWK